MTLVRVVGWSRRHRRWEGHGAGRVGQCCWSPSVGGDDPGHRPAKRRENKGMRYPAGPPSVEEIVLVMRHAGDRAYVPSW